MGLPNTALAGMEDSQQAPPQEQSGQQAPDATLALMPPPLTQRVAQATDNAASQQTAQQAQKPGAWARSVLAGVQDALAGFGAGGKVPPGAGALYGAGAAARQAREHTEQQAQQKFENQQKTQQMTREEAIARATIAHENAATVYDETNTHRLSEEMQDEAVKSGTAALQPYLDAGAPIVQEGVDSTQIQNLIKEKKLDPTKLHAFPTARVDSGQKDADGNPILRNVYTIVGDVPQVKLDAATAALISTYTPYKLPEGSTMSGLVYGTLVTRAKAAQTAQMTIDQQLEEAGLKKAQLDEAAAARKMLPDWNMALAKAKGNVSSAMLWMQTDPAMKSKYPDASVLVPDLYGGEREFESVRHNQIEEQQNAEKNAIEEQKLKQAQETGPGATWGNVEAPTAEEYRASLSPQQLAAVDLVGQGRAPINRPDYILARNPAFIEAVAKLYPDVDLSRVSAYQSAYKDFTSGKDADQLQAGAVALKHLQQLRQINDANPTTVRIHGTKANQAYNNLLDTVASELGRFYDNNTIPAIADYKKTLGGAWGGLINRDAAIDQQVHSMGVRMDTFDEKWKAASPSKAYEAQMPANYREAREARSALDPAYAATQTPAPKPNGPTATNAQGQKVMWNGSQWVRLQ